MNEIQKNIETCRGEDVLAEVSALPQDPHFGSLVNEALDPLKQQAAAQEGWDGYSEVIAQHKPYTFASAIVQMKSNLLLLLRMLWQFPFGTGTIRSLSDMWSHYIDRLHGSETYGIPSRLSSLTDLPSAPLLLADRKISGVPEAADGESLIHLLGASASLDAITTIEDDNRGWLMNKLPPTMNGVTKATIGMIQANLRIDTFIPNCQELHLPDCEDGGYTVRSSLGYQSFIGGQNGALYLNVLDAPKLKYTNGISLLGSPEELTLPILETTIKTENGYTFMLPTTKKLYLPEFDRIGYIGNATWIYAPILEELHMPKCRGVQSKAGWPTIISASGTLKKIVFGKLDYNLSQPNSQSTSILALSNATSLIDIEIGAGTAVNLNLSSWSPTLDSSNLEQFLSNFRTYIALRLATFDSNGPTLTLSQAVYDAIKDESHLFVFDEGTMTIYAYLTNIKHWTVTK